MCLGPEGQHPLSPSAACLPSRPCKYERANGEVSLFYLPYLIINEIEDLFVLRAICLSVSLVHIYVRLFELGRYGFV